MQGHLGVGLETGGKQFLQGSVDAMLDRSAESLFWIGRYIERAENHARLLDVHYHMRELGGDEEESVWRTMTEAIGDTGVYEARHATYNERDVLYFLLLDPSMNNSLLSCVVHARDNFKKVREQLPSCGTC